MNVTTLFFNTRSKNILMISGVFPVVLRALKLSGRS